MYRNRDQQGSFKDTTPDVLLAEVLSAVLARTGVSPSDVGEVREDIRFWTALPK